jgi:cell wall-associated NlpC family hydrolase
VFLPSFPRLLAPLLPAVLIAAGALPAPAEARKVHEAGEIAAPAKPARPVIGKRALRAARTYLGTPSAWGGESAGGLDCSGLVVVSFRKVGRKLPHYTGALWKLGRPVRRGAKLHVGDLVFFRLSGGVPGHVGIYAGKGRYIHSPSSGERVRYGLMRDRADDFAGARRLR